MITKATIEMMIEGTISAARSTAAGALARSARAMKMQTIETARPTPDRKSGIVTAMKRAASALIGAVKRPITYSVFAVSAIAIAATTAATSDS